MKNKLKPAALCFLIVLFTFQTKAQKPGGVTIIDSRHYSNAFGEMRNYRIFLPPHYFENTQRRYPVIYFMHGWSQRYFGDGGQAYAEFDKGNDNKGDNIENFVASHDVIVVKSDGYNRRPDEQYYLRPYNIGPVETSRQFPIYYPELIQYIDTHYRTLADREHRAISGLSMGGFMAFWIGGKYPDLFSAAGNFCGSAEFVVGPKNFPVEYRHIDMYKNYEGMDVRLNYGDKDFIRAYHRDMNNIWPQVMDNYEYRVYEAEHSTCGLGDMFGFFMNTFEHPPAKPQRWDHTDVYPAFSVWDYQLSSDRNLPGFTILENVDKNGFRCSVREFLPDGPLMPFVNLSMLTPPFYQKNTMYVINDVNTKNLTATQRTVQSDSAGRLQIAFNGSVHEISITKKQDKPGPNISIAEVKIQNMPWAIKGKDVAVSIKLLNKGLAGAKHITARLYTTKINATIKKAESTFGDIPTNEIRACDVPFSFRVENDSFNIEKFRLVVQDDNKNQWVESLVIPVRKDVAEIKDFEIADGKVFTVAKGGTDLETILLGSGNGDGIANPGESIVILVRDKDRYWRTELTVADPFVNPFGMNVRISDDWTPFDHVGASAKYSVPLISSDCPENHYIDLFAEYWLPDYPFHIIKQGVIKMEVKGRDNTPPTIGPVQVAGDNIIRAKVYDGSKIQSVKATFILSDDPSKTFTLELRDDGLEQDGAEGDDVFSKKIPDQKFGIYRVILEATDSFGNTKREEIRDTFVLH